MARTAGSINRGTMIKRLVEAGREFGYLDGMPRDKLKDLYDDAFGVKYDAKVKTVQKALPPKPVVERTKLAREVAQPIYDHCIRTLNKLRNAYDLEGDLPELPERIEDYANKVFLTCDIVEADAVAKRAYDKMFMHLMWLLSEGRISGTGNQRYNEKRAVKAEQLAKWLESKGQLENALQQRARAVEIRRKMAEFKAQREVA